MRTKHLVKSALMSTGLILASTITANAACYVAQGNATATNQSDAEALAIQDAYKQVNNTAASQASASKPICSVADDFERGISTYNCQVDVSFCDAPRPTKKHVKHHKGSKFFTRWNIKRTHRTHTIHTGESCLHFRAKAQGRSKGKAHKSMQVALNDKMIATTGNQISSSNVALHPAQCAKTGRKVYTCTQSARFCQGYSAH